MNRIEREKCVVNTLNQLFSSKGFLLSDEKYKKEHYAVFLGSEKEANYMFNVLFDKYSYAKCYITIVYPKLNLFCKNLDIERLKGGLDAFTVRLSGYLHPKNTDGYFNTGLEIESPMLTESTSGNEIVQYIYQDLFLRCVPKIITETDTLEKAYSLANDIPTLFKGNDKVKMRIYSTSFPSEVLTGILLAKLLNKPDSSQIIELYLSYTYRFEEKYGANEVIDLIRKVGRL